MASKQPKKREKSEGPRVMRVRVGEIDWEGSPYATPMDETCRDLIARAMEGVIPVKRTRVKS